MVPLKYLSNFWRTLEMSLINCEVILHLKWSKMYYGTLNNQNTSFQITYTQFCVPVVALSNQENMKLLKQLESCFEKTINWNKYLAKTTNQARNIYLDYLIGPSFQGVNRLFALSGKYDDGRESHRQNYLPTVEIKDYVMIDGRDFLDQPI